MMLNFALALVLLFKAVSASSGDRAQLFQECKNVCYGLYCQDKTWKPESLALHLTGWSCLDNCQYECMHSLTDTAVELGTTIQQYYGKWPFWRLAGMQEPASVAFSLLNMFFHFRGAAHVARRIPDSHPMKRYYMGFAAVSINAWAWSSIFHTRDLRFTEKMDYFSAALAIMYALFYTAVRLFHLYKLPERATSPRVTSRLWTGWATLCSIAFIGHVSYLSLLPRFDYTYNMAFNLIVGVLHNILWLIYSLPSKASLIWRFPARSKSYRPNCANQAGIFVLLTTAATALELFDFPPWYRIIDAHSLWHLATAPIAAMWYNFLIADALDDGWKGQKHE